MITMDETIRAIVFCGFATRADFMAGVTEKDGKFEVVGRVRFHRENTGDPFKDKDRKEWFKARKGYGNLEEALQEIDELMLKFSAFAKMTGRGTKDEPDVLIREEGESVDSFAKRLTAKPWAYSQKGTLQ